MGQLNGVCCLVLTISFMYEWSVVNGFKSAGISANLKKFCGLSRFCRLSLGSKDCYHSGKRSEVQDITLSSVVVDWGRPDRVFIQDQGHRGPHGPRLCRWCFQKTDLGCLPGVVVTAPCTHSGSGGVLAADSWRY